MHIVALNFFCNTLVKCWYQSLAASLCPGRHNRITNSNKLPFFFQLSVSLVAPLEKHLQHPKCLTPHFCKTHLTLQVQGETSQLNCWKIRCRYLHAHPTSWTHVRRPRGSIGMANSWWRWRTAGSGSNPRWSTIQTQDSRDCTKTVSQSKNGRLGKKNNWTHAEPIAIDAATQDLNYQRFIFIIAHCFYFSSKNAQILHSTEFQARHCSCYAWITFIPSNLSISAESA